MLTFVGPLYSRKKKKKSRKRDRGQERPGGNTQAHALYVYKTISFSEPAIFFQKGLVTRMTQGVLKELFE